MNPVITNMKDFAIIVNSFQLLTIVAKNFILNVAGFLDLPLYCNKLLYSQAKTLSWFIKPKSMDAYGETILIN